MTAVRALTPLAATAAALALAVPGASAADLRPPLSLPGAASAANTDVGTWIVGARPGRASTAIARRYGARRITAGGWVAARTDARALAEELQRAGRLTFAEPNHLRRSQQAPPAPAVADDPRSAEARWRDHVVDPALAPPPVTPESPLLALVDSKLDTAHPEFAGGNVTTSGDRAVENAHGTATAAVAAAPKNEAGILGIWPGMRALNVSLPATDVSCADSASGIARATRARAAVINMSYGSAAFCFLEYQALQQATGRGITLVAAAGNEFDLGNPLEFPASLPHVLTVAASTPNREPAFFSNENAAIDLAAPGTGILTAVPPAFEEDDVKDGYQLLDGTSFSAPMVAAAAAWVRAVRTDLSADQVAQVVRLSAQDIGREGWDPASGFGVLDLKAALERAVPPRDPREPNDDIPFVDGDAFGKADPPIWSGRGRATVTGLLDLYEDPGDVYRLRVRPRSAARVTVKPRFGNPDLEAYAGSARHVEERRSRLATSRRGSTATDAMTLRNRSRRTVTVYVRVHVRGRDRGLDAYYTLRVRRL